jgi:signal transduction histidine kinase
LNIYNNAFYAVNEKKKLQPKGFEPKVSVTTSLISPLQGLPALPTGQAGGQAGGPGWALIRIRDNGMGIPKKVLDKIFQPFFTTKPAGEGTGLGLSLSYDIITKGHGGELKMETHEGEGAEFIIRLPIV